VEDVERERRCNRGDSSRGSTTDDGHHDDNDDEHERDVGIANVTSHRDQERGSTDWCGDCGGDGNRPSPAAGHAAVDLVPRNGSWFTVAAVHRPTNTPGTGSTRRPIFATV
jgi:hypothetical protein